MIDITCKRCGESKPASEYGDDSRTETGKARTCRACKKPISGRPKGTGTVAKARQTRALATIAEASPAPTLALELHPGFGVRAYVEDGRLVLEQGRDDGAVDNVTLSRTEVKVLFAQFVEWAA